MFLQKIEQMGFDLYQVQDFLEHKGICEDQVQVLLDNINNPGFVNVLRYNPAPMHQ